MGAIRLEEVLSDKEKRSIQKEQLANIETRVHALTLDDLCKIAPVMFYNKKWVDSKVREYNNALALRTLEELLFRAEEQPNRYVFNF